MTLLRAHTTVCVCAHASARERAEQRHAHTYLLACGLFLLFPFLLYSVVHGLTAHLCRGIGGWQDGVPWDRWLARRCAVG